jgi:hypothetical protein
MFTPYKKAIKISRRIKKKKEEKKGNKTLCSHEKKKKKRKKRKKIKHTLLGTQNNTMSYSKRAHKCRKAATHHLS